MVEGKIKLVNKRVDRLDSNILKVVCGLSWNERGEALDTPISSLFFEFCEIAFQILPRWEASG